MMKRIPYGEDARQFVDLFSPTAKTTAGRSSLLVFIHGGAWISEATEDFYDLARAVSSNGNRSVALVEYRLSTVRRDGTEQATSDDVRHPDHVHDVFAALEMLFDAQIAQRHGYTPDAAVLCGHSAGAHMALAVALDSRRSVNRPIDVAIPKRIKSFILVEPIISLVEMLSRYPSYTYFVLPAFYPPNSHADVEPPFAELEVAGAEAWVVRPPGAYHGTPGTAPEVHFICSKEDELLDTAYQRSSMALLQGKGLFLHADIDSYTGSHGHLLHTDRFWKFLVEACSSTPSL